MHDQYAKIGKYRKVEAAKIIHNPITMVSYVNGFTFFFLVLFISLDYFYSKRKHKKKDIRLI